VEAAVVLLAEEAATVRAQPVAQAVWLSRGRVMACAASAPDEAWAAPGRV
jgi:hypothetical protein